MIKAFIFDPSIHTVSLIKYCELPPGCLYIYNGIPRTIDGINISIKASETDAPDDYTDWSINDSTPEPACGDNWPIYVIHHRYFCYTSMLPGESHLPDQP